MPQEDCALKRLQKKAKRGMRGWLGESWGRSIGFCVNGQQLLLDAGRRATIRPWQMAVKSWPNSDLRRHTYQLGASGRHPLRISSGSSEPEYPRSSGMGHFTSSRVSSRLLPRGGRPRLPGWWRAFCSSPTVPCSPRVS
jgi:hypothetical protein